ncbi:methylenetetrahydrofolate reductase [Candidatus Pyrohabitans sp.]
MKAHSRFMRSLLTREFTISGEVDPPRDASREAVEEQVRYLKEHVVAANVTDNPIGDVIMNTLAPCVIMQELGLEAIYQATCRDRNRIALQSDIIGAAALGIKNVLALTGDHPKMGNHPQAKPVFDLDSVLLTRVLRTLREGSNMAGEKLEHPPRVHIGVGLSPGVEPLEPEIIKLEKKIEAGAEFVQTQCIYDEKVLERLREATSHLDVPILPGIAPLRSLGMAKFMLANVPGISIPEDMLAKLEKSDNLTETAIDITAELISAVKDYGFPGVHIMPVGMDRHVGEMIARSGVRG